jgi:hypothetical protein
MPDYDDEESYIIPGADFEHAEDQGAARRSNNPAAIQGWRALVMGKTIGKRVNIAIPTGETQRTQSFNLFEIGGASNNDAIQMCITLINPKFIPVSKLPGGVIPPDNTFINNATGERSNLEFLLDDFNVGFPGWVPAVALIEWGIGGVQGSAEVDWVNGTTINITASWVRISAFIDQAQTFIGIASGIVCCQAFVGPGGIFRGIAAQRSVVTGPIRQADSAIPVAGFPFTGFGPNADTYPTPMFPIPNMAKDGTVSAIISNLGFNRSVNDFDLQLLYFASTSQAVVGAARFTNNIRAPALVPNGAAYFTVQNMSNGIDHIVLASTVIFNLSI